MKGTIFFFVKVFEKEDYLNDFLDGKLFMNTLAYFKNMEEKEVSNRGDKHEAVIGWYQPNKITVKVNDLEIKDLAGPLSIQMDHHENLNVFCLYAAHSGEFDCVTEETLPLLKEQLKISEECSKLGGFSVMVTNASKFIARVRDAAEKMGFPGSGGLVEYYDPATFNGEFSDSEAVFRKRKEFSHQSEYRIALKAGNEFPSSIILDIGSIRDIARICTFSEINTGLEVRLPENA